MNEKFYSSSWCDIDNTSLTIVKCDSKLKIIISNNHNNPIQSDALRNLYIRQVKNDSHDSFIIAQVIRFGHYSEGSIQAAEYFELRELCRARTYIIDLCADIKKKVITLLDQVFPEYSKKLADEYRAEIALYKASQKYFNEKGLKKLPNIKSLNADLDKLYKEKSSAYTDYKKLKKDYQEIQTVKRNIEIVLGDDEIKRQKEKSQDER